MRRVVDIARAAARTHRVNAADVEMLLLLGWRLTDEPDCSGARMLPPNPTGEIPQLSSVPHRVPATENFAGPGMKKAGPHLHCGTGDGQHNGSDTRTRGDMQR